ncbi:hypothetical protein, partial [Microcoleus anatoxicus]|uniref:hypothetical protein n=1 Tax=Microcoleus anatoxicus TaxID=2705319 RepID=UPI0030C93418
RRKKEEGRRKKEEGRRKKEEGRRKKEEGRRKKEEGRRKKNPPLPPPRGEIQGEVTGSSRICKYIGMGYSIPVVNPSF